jgi:hypothetical protein
MCYSTGQRGPSVSYWTAPQYQLLTKSQQCIQQNICVVSRQHQKEEGLLHIKKQHGPSVKSNSALERFSDRPGEMQRPFFAGACMAQGTSTLESAQFINETNMIQSVLFGMQTRTFCPNLTAINGILVSLVAARTLVPVSCPCQSDGIQSVLFGMQNRNFCPCLTATTVQ